jgi:hypothetical protein
MTRNTKLAAALDKALKERIVSKMTDNVRDIMIVLLGSTMLRMESDGLNVGQTVDLLMKLLDQEGYEIAKKQNTTVFHVGGGPLP